MSEPRLENGLFLSPANDTPLSLSFSNKEGVFVDSIWKPDV